jgi:hypothetical protein
MRSWRARTTSSPDWFQNKLQATLAHVLPDTAVAEMHRQQAEPNPGRVRDRIIYRQEVYLRRLR